ncbi:MAG TPA: PrsW family intramembrane metalloprotease [Longimicrobiales bacterium]|nr:PrsW family intramembrane metalloprotease [Longimicrobiales bacterium]
MAGHVARMVAAVNEQATLRPRVWGVPFRVAFGVVTIAALLLLHTLVTWLGPGQFAVGAFFAFLPVPLYVGLALWLDRNEPEPRWILLKAFLWGAVIATLLSIYGNNIALAWVLAAGASESASEVFGAVIAAPIIEEVTKGAALILLLIHQHEELDNVLDGIIYAGMIALGFAATENVLYYGANVAWLGEVLHTRGFISPFAHPLFTSMTGIGVALAAHRHGLARVVLPLVGLTGAIALHMIWNGAAVMGQYDTMYLLIMMPIFLAVLGLVAATLRRERLLIARYLSREAERGHCSSADVQLLSSAEGVRGFREGLLGNVHTRHIYLTRLRARNAAAELCLLQWRREHSRTARGAASELVLREQLITCLAQLHALAPTHAAVRMQLANEARPT